MSKLSITTLKGTNYRGGAQGVSNVVGWDSGLVRSEVYSFTTGSLPVSSISFISPSVWYEYTDELFCRLPLLNFNPLSTCETASLYSFSEI